MDNSSFEDIETRIKEALMQLLDMPADSKNSNEALIALSRKAGARVGQSAGQLMTSVDRYNEKIGTYVRDNPVQAIIVSGTLGIVIGSVLTSIFCKRSR